MIKHIETVEEFEEFIKEGKVIIDFYANWCGPCKMLAPVLENLDQEVNDLKIGKINVDDLEELAERYAVFSIPTLILIKDGQELKKQVGFMPKDSLKHLIEKTF